jgi:3-hydroxyacyl-[acyl-carrier-protein] dehydratase
VTPGDQLYIHARKSRRRGPVWKFNGRAEVEGVLVAEAVISAMIVDE